MLRYVCFLAILVCFLAIACGSGSNDDSALALIPAKPSGGVYLALGDSFAAGSGASDPANTSYVALIDSALKQRLGDSVQLQSLAAGGHTTQDLIDKQLPAALDALRVGNVRLVTVTIGGNDLDILQSDPNAAACIADVNDPKCPVAKILVGTEHRLEQILSALRTPAPSTVIVIEKYPNLFSGSGNPLEPSATTAFGLLDDVIDRAARRNHVLIADPRAAFVGRSLELTHIHDTPADAHPNDAGHKLIADAFLKVLSLPTPDATAQ